MTPSGFVSLTQIHEEVDRAIQKLGPEVVRVRYNTGEDTSGEPALHFRIILTDAASREETLGTVSRRIKNTLSDETRSYERWGLYPYFSFRSESEQAAIGDLKWA